MQSEEGREELRQGSFDLDATTERILEVGAAAGQLEAPGLLRPHTACWAWHPLPAPLLG